MAVPLGVSHIDGSPVVVAPDGSEVTILGALPGASFARFRLDAGAASVAVRHRSVDELWLVLEGAGEIWAANEAGSGVVVIGVGAIVTIRAGTTFQFRAGSGQALVIVATTSPPWPGDAEAEVMSGAWPPTVPLGPRAIGGVGPPSVQVLERGADITRGDEHHEGHH